MAKQKQASMSGEVEARMRERSRVRAILSSRPGLQLLFEAYALEIPESLLEVDNKNVTKSSVFKASVSVPVFKCTLYMVTFTVKVQVRGREKTFHFRNCQTLRLRAPSTLF